MKFEGIPIISPYSGKAALFSSLYIKRVYSLYINFIFLFQHLWALKSGGNTKGLK